VLLTASPYLPSATPGIEAGIIIIYDGIMKWSCRENKYSNNNPHRCARYTSVLPVASKHTQPFPLETLMHRLTATCPPALLSRFPLYSTTLVKVHKPYKLVTTRW